MQQGVLHFKPVLQKVMSRQEKVNEFDHRRVKHSLRNEEALNSKPAYILQENKYDFPNRLLNKNCFTNTTTKFSSPMSFLKGQLSSNGNGLNSSQPKHHSIEPRRVQLQNDYVRKYKPSKTLMGESGYSSQKIPIQKQKSLFT